MANVFLAEDTKLERFVAIKVMLRKHAERKKAKARFLREARTVARLRHDHIVSIHDVGEDRGIPYLAMELLKGMSLQRFLALKKSLTIASIIRVAREITAGLSEAHRHGIIHRDIKPDNIWLEAPHGRVKLLDFGLARFENDDTQITHDGAIIGTPAYMAPEQARGHKLDVRSDLFSLGVVLYTLASGQQPFSGASTIAVLTAIAVDKPRPLRELNPDIPEPFERLIHQLLEKDADLRPSSATDVLQHIQSIAYDGTDSEIAIESADFEMQDFSIPSHANNKNQSNELKSLTHAAFSRRHRGRMITVSCLALLTLLGVGIANKDFFASSRKFAFHDTTSESTNGAENNEDAGGHRTLGSIRPDLAMSPFSPQQAKEHQKAWADYLGLPIEFINARGMKFRLIPPGEYLMGLRDEEIAIWPKLIRSAPNDAWHNATPSHRVRISQPFYMAEREVQVSDFITHVKDTSAEMLANTVYDIDRNTVMRNCTWLNCIKYCNQLSAKEGLTPAYQIAGKAVHLVPGANGFRLPSEAQWEYACRAGSTSPWSFHLPIDSIVNDLDEATNLLKLKNQEPNAFGLYNMYGNSEEWCWDWYGVDYYRKCNATELVVDPIGPPSGQMRVRRGGGYLHARGGDPSLVNSTSRIAGFPEEIGNVGFGRMILPIMDQNQNIDKAIYHYTTFQRTIQNATICRDRNLLELVDPKLDVLAGEWLLFDKGFISEKHSINSWLRLPVDPGLEYTLKIKFSTNNGNMMVVLPEGKGLELVMTGNRIVLMSTQEKSNDPTATLSYPLYNNNIHDIKISVSKRQSSLTNITVSVDGKLCLESTLTAEEIERLLGVYGVRGSFSPQRCIVIGSYRTNDGPAKLLEAKLTTEKVK
ncbi:MAG: bifunctional serine/threonine-protein kinase/formylglycine-generating enzyme family protein [Gemmataceae bacterium]